MGHGPYDHGMGAKQAYIKSRGHLFKLSKRGHMEGPPHTIAWESESRFQEEWKIDFSSLSLSSLGIKEH